MNFYDHVPKCIDSLFAGKLLFVGIAGPAGVGKSTTADNLRRRLVAAHRGVHVICMDDFLKSPEERRNLGEWGPDHVRIQELRKVLQLAKAGHTLIRSDRYVRAPEKKIEPCEMDLRGVDVVILEGLYALSDSEATGKLVEFVDIGVYLTAPMDQIRKWRFQQETQKPSGRSVEQMENHWTEGIVPDTERNVEPSKKNAHIVVEVTSEHELLMTQFMRSGV